MQSQLPKQSGRSTTEPSRLVICVDAPALSTEADAASDGRLISVDTLHEAIGELATHLQTGRLAASDRVVIVAPVGRLAPDAQQITAALRRLHPRTRVVGVVTPGIEHDARLLTALGIDLAPAESLEERFSVRAASPQRVEPHLSEGDREPGRGPIDLPQQTPHPSSERPKASSAPAEQAPRTSESTDDSTPDVEQHSPGSLTGMADEKLADLVVRDPAQVPEACLHMLRQRLGIEGLHLLAPGEAPIPDCRGARIHLDPPSGEPLGTLVVDREHEHLAYAWSGWLASWLEAAARIEQLRRDSETDALTGAWNRRYLLRYLRDSIDSAREQRQSLSVMVFDVDDLKAYNDRFGHAAGDEVLREAVRLLRSVIRPGDRVCRVGGDEFVVVFYDPAGPRSPDSEHPRSAEDLVRRFQTQVAQCRFPKLGEEAPGSLSVSGGLATFPWDGVDAEGLVRCADERALQAKREGKNAIVFGRGASARGDRSS